VAIGDPFPGLKTVNRPTEDILHKSTQAPIVGPRRCSPETGRQEEGCPQRIFSHEFWNTIQNSVRHKIWHFWQNWTRSQKTSLFNATGKLHVNQIDQSIKRSFVNVSKIAPSHFDVQCSQWRIQLWAVRAPPPHWPKLRAGHGGATQTRGQIFT